MWLKKKLFSSLVKKKICYFDLLLFLEKIKMNISFITPTGYFSNKKYFDESSKRKTIKLRLCFKKNSHLSMSTDKPENQLKKK